MDPRCEVAWRKVLQHGSGILKGTKITERVNLQFRAEQASRKPRSGSPQRPNEHQRQIRRFDDSRLWLAYGHFRSGILLALATAERIAAQIAGIRELTGSFRSV
jgi:hypothetical protein